MTLKNVQLLKKAQTPIESLIAYTKMHVDVLSGSKFILLSFLHSVRLFGNSGACSACGQSIPASELVMRAQGNVYHMKVKENYIEF